MLLCDQRFYGVGEVKDRIGQILKSYRTEDLRHRTFRFFVIDPGRHEPSAKGIKKAKGTDASVPQ